MKHYRLGLICAMVILSTSCQPDDQIVATCNGQPITVADLDAFLLTLPEKARHVKEGESHEQWVEASLGRMAVEQALMATDTARELVGSSEIEALRTSGKVKILVERLMSRLTASFEPDQETVTRITAELSDRADTRTLFTFEHIFFRLDRASSPADLRLVRARAAEVAAEAHAGGDFAELVRLHSQSADAQRGGILANVASADLEGETSRVLSTMQEGDISPVVETRTGLHIFKLRRRLDVEGPDADRIGQMARQLASRRWLQAERAALLERLRKDVPVSTEGSPWQVGSWSLDEETVQRLSTGLGGPDKVRSALVDELLLAEEALANGLWTPELERANEHRVRVVILERCFREERRAYLETLTEDRLRPFYEAQPSAFASPEMADVDIIFVPQGRDAFQTQRELEGHVAALRSGASFADLAREISEGPSADQGGAVGIVERNQWGAWGQAVFEAIRSLEPGQISDPVYCTDRVLTRTPTVLKGGFAIVRVKERIPEKRRTFEEARDAVRRAYVVKNRREVDDEVRKKLREQIGFEIHRIPAAEEFRR